MQNAFFSFRYSFIFLMGMLALSACYRPKEGCQDLAATNLDVAADKPCPACCTYPLLKLSIRQKYDTLTFIENKIYEGIPGQFFRLKNVSFYLSDFEILQEQQSLTVTDTLTFKLFGASVSDTVKRNLTDDFVLVRRASDAIEVGNFRNFGNFSGIKIRVGLNDEEQKIISRTTPANHPLQRQQDSLWHGYNEGYVFMQLVLAKDTALANTKYDTISITRSNWTPQILQTSSAFVVNHRSGFNFQINMEADYKKLLSGINWLSDDKITQKNKIVANIPATFRFLE